MNTGPTPAIRQLVYARANYRCEKCNSNDGPFAVHHRRPRGMGGTRRESTNSPSALLLLCEPCHLWTESHRTEALLLGLLVTQHHDPATTLVHLHHGVCLLTDFGGREVAA